MSVEDDTVDFDLYGNDDEKETPQPPQSVLLQETAVDDDLHDVTTDPSATIDGAVKPVSQSDSYERSQSLKRKASEEVHTHQSEQATDARTLDQGAQAALKLSELQWWISEEDLRGYCAQAKAESELLELAFGEHKINGKSKGEAYLEFSSPQAAGIVKREFEKANAEIEASGDSNGPLGKHKVSVWYTAPGNPFKARDTGGKKEMNTNGRFNGHQHGGYNHYQNNRGGYGRGRANFAGSRGGGNTGGGQWSSGQQQNSNFANPMMNGFGNMGFGGFGNMDMNAAAMMSSMMGMAGMGMMPQMMANRGGANMMTRGGGLGGRGGHMSSDGLQQGGYNNQGWDQNKKPRKE